MKDEIDLQRADQIWAAMRHKVQWPCNREQLLSEALDKAGINSTKPRVSYWRFLRKRINEALEAEDRAVRIAASERMALR